MHAYLTQLADALRSEVSLNTYNLLENDHVTGVKILPGKEGTPETEDRNCLYVCEYRRLRFLPVGLRLPPLLCVVEAGVKPVATYFHDRKVIAVFGNTVSDVLALVAEKMFALGTQTSNTAEIMHDLRDCQGLDDLMLQGFRLLNNPIVVTDESHQIVAATSPALVSDDSYAGMINKDYIPVGIPSAASGNAEWKVLMFQRSDDLPDSDQVVTIIKLLRLHGQVLGCIHIVQYAGELTNEQFAVAELLSGLVAVELWTRRRCPASNRTGKEEMDYFLRNILDGSGKNSVEIERQRKSLRLELKAHLHMAAVSIPVPGENAKLPLNELSIKFTDLIPNANAFVYQDAIMIFINSPFEIHDFTEYLRPIEPDILQNRLSVGVSNPFHTLDKLPIAAYQASEAIRLACFVRPDQKLCLFKHYQVYHMFRLCMVGDEVDNICLPEVKNLLDYCRESGTYDLIDTLYMLIQNGMNKAKTAADLYVHVNTVKYRLSQIETLTGLNLNDADEMLSLMLSLKFLNFRKKLAEQKLF